VEDALGVVADTVALGVLNARFSQQAEGSTQNVNDALSYLHRHFSSVDATENFSWNQARNSFVDIFSRLALKS
jgi:hypothetical protein